MTRLSNYFKMKQKHIIVYIPLGQTTKKKNKTFYHIVHNYITSGLLPHNLTLKENTIIMLSRKLQIK